jgi:rhamnulokinase
MKRHRFLAFDLGAESGRCVLGTLEGGVLSVQELHRFPNSPVAIEGHLHWDVPALFGEIKTGLRLCAERGRLDIEGVAVDTWGVDFGLLDKAGRLIGFPFAYRDLRNVPAMEAFLAKFPKDRIYEITGIQFLPFNSLFQLYALALHNPGLLSTASDLLFMPDLFSYFLSGSIANEATIASTSQLLDPRGPGWSEELLGALGVPSRLFHPPVRPGAVIGRLLPSIASETGIGEIPVIATASHDTASAVAAVPARGTNWAYISSGTWSLVGIDVPAPQITPG